jgi:DNA polymerase-3 subunit beta
MKAKFNRSALQDALGLAASIVPARTPKPILHCLKMTAENDVVTLCATDLEVGITTRVNQVEIIEPGEIVVPADKLNSIVRESSDDVVEISSEDMTVLITGSDSQFTIYGHQPEQYPAVADFDGDSDFGVSLESLQKALELTVFAAAKESTRYAINGILWEVDGKKLILVATDGRRLARAIVALDSAADKKLAGQNIIVPAKTMTLLDRVAGASEEKVSVKFADNKIILHCGDVMISSNLVEGNFPKYEDIIPSEYVSKLTLGTEAGLSAVRRAALLANEESKGVKLTLEKNSLLFSSRTPETGDARIEMKVDFSGEPLEIGFNPQFLIDVLRVIEDETFDLELGEADRPGVIRTGADFLYIVMPVNI